MRFALAVAVLLAAVGPSWAASDTIRCTSPGHSPVTITLNARRFGGRPLSCIDGSFAGDLTPCAPDGAFGLSAPTGDAALVSLVNRWQDYHDYTGGVTSFGSTKTIIFFTGGFNSPENGLDDAWTFTADRLSGTAELKQKGKSDLAYTCVKARAKF